MRQKYIEQKGLAIKGQPFCAINLDLNMEVKDID